MYKYEKEKQKLFTENGQVVFLRVRDFVRETLESSKYIDMEQVLDNVYTGDNWITMSCVDRLVELGELVEITNNHVAGQNRVFKNAL